MSQHPEEIDERAFADACAADSILSAWLAPEYLDPRPLRAAALARSVVRWVVADHFFREERLISMMRHHSRLNFQDDDVGLNYHSRAVRLDRQPDGEGLELLRHPLWHAYAAFVTATRLGVPNRTVVKYRRHPPHSHGFWLHTDRDTEHPKALAVLGYFNRAWRAADGGLLQIWDVGPAVSTDPVEQRALRWDEYLGKRLSFLNDSTRLRIEAIEEQGSSIVDAFLIDQIVPAFNRVVFLDFQSSPAFHSITPTCDRNRDGFVQWLY